MPITDTAIMDIVMKSAPATSRKLSGPRMSKLPANEAEYRLPAKTTKPRCNCGQCATCQDDARWERIFREKFADPLYYQRPMRGKSSLVF